MVNQKKANGKMEGNVMNVSRYMFFVAAALVMSAVCACQKENVSVDDEVSVQRTVTLTASIGQSSTKASLGEWTGTEYPVLWDEGDAIAVMNNGRLFKFVIDSEDAGKTVADFICNEAEGYDESMEITAYYPYGAVTYSEGTVTCAIPAVQEYVEGGFGKGAAPMAASRQAGDDAGLVFNNIFGVFKVQIKGVEGETVSAFEVGSSKVLAGSATLADDLTFTMPGTDAPSNVSLSFPSPVDISQTKDFLVALPAGEQILAFVVTTDKGRYYKKTTAKKSVEAGKVMKMPLVDLGAEDSELREMMSVRYSEDNTDGVFVGYNVWANVNCGYHPTDYKWGKIYQWGRKDGCGYNDGGNYQETMLQTFRDGQFEWDGTGTCQPEAGIFYRSDNASQTFHWMTGNGASKKDMWNAGTSVNPVKTIYDPCPEGWRVPVGSEFIALMDNCSSFVTVDSYPGWWLSGTDVYDESMAAKVFFPAAGQRYNNIDGFGNRGEEGYYWADNYNGSMYLKKNTRGSYRGSRSEGLYIRCVKE